jgi:hypothetical protein
LRREREVVVWREVQGQIRIVLELVQWNSLYTYFMTLLYGLVSRGSSVLAGENLYPSLESLDSSSFSLWLFFSSLPLPTFLIIGIIVEG